MDLLFYTFRNLFTLTSLKYHSECNLQLNNSLKFHHQFLLLEHFQGWRKRVGRLGVRLPTFWQNRRRYQAAAARRITTCPLRFLDLAPSLNSVKSLWNLSLVLGPLALELYYYILFFSLFNFHPLIPFSGIESSMFL